MIQRKQLQHLLMRLRMLRITFEDMSDESENQTTSNYATGSVEVTDTLDEILNQNVSVSGSSAEILPAKTG